MATEPTACLITVHDLMFAVEAWLDTKDEDVEIRVADATFSRNVYRLIFVFDNHPDKPMRLVLMGGEVYVKFHHGSKYTYEYEKIVPESLPDQRAFFEAVVNAGRRLLVR